MEASLSKGLGFEEPPHHKIPASGTASGAKGFLKRLYYLLRGYQPSTATRFEVIGLGSIRNRFAAHWPVIEKKVHAVVRIIISRHMSSGDRWIALPSDRYKVVFSGLTEREARQRAAGIRNDILRVFSMGGQMMVDLGISGMHTVYAPKRKSCNVVPLRDDIDLPPLLRVAEEIAQYDETATRKPRQQDALQAPFLLFRGRAPDTAIKVSQKRPVLRYGEDGKPIMPQPVEHYYRPVWDCAENRLAAFDSYVRHIMSDGTRVEEYDVLPEDAEDAMYQELDVMILRNAIRGLLAMADYPEKLNHTICPVNYRTVKNPAYREMYFAVAEEVPEEMRQYFALEIVHMPPALYGSHLEDPLHALRRFCRSVIVRRSIDFGVDQGLAAAGAGGVSVDFSPCRDMDPQAFQKKLGVFVKSAGQEKLRTYAFGLHTPEWMHEAEMAGFSCLAGEAVTRTE